MRLLGTKYILNIIKRTIDLVTKKGEIRATKGITRFIVESHECIFLLVLARMRKPRGDHMERKRLREEVSSDGIGEVS